MFISFSFEIQVSNHFPSPLEKVHSSFLEILVNDFAEDIEYHDPWVGKFEMISEGLSAFVDQIRNKGYIVVYNVLFHFHFLLEFLLHLLVFLLDTYLVLLLPFVL